MTDTIQELLCPNGHRWFSYAMVEDCQQCKIDRLERELAQEKQWALEAQERAGGVEEKLRTKLAVAREILADADAYCSLVVHRQYEFENKEVRDALGSISARARRFVRDLDGKP